eukprot:TRINITY_DN69799_c0_g1_i1.p1 TRINITY_DN69799_c0_g1~~TRINITY_DN69799_c0_g1_i1.p1  ORF type:complete len:584 (+),score=94.47 TRINITY_DN69799_c0_g1_i1:30-1781(+)
MAALFVKKGHALHAQHAAMLQGLVVCRCAKASSRWRRRNDCFGATSVQRQNKSSAVLSSTAPAEKCLKLEAANRITLIGAGVSLGGAVAKGVAGVASGSASLVADAAHSLSDLLSDGVTWWAINAARRPLSDDLPWGSGRYEALGSMAVGSMVIATGVGVGVFSLIELAPLAHAQLIAFSSSCSGGMLKSFSDALLCVLGSDVLPLGDAGGPVDAIPITTATPLSLANAAVVACLGVVVKEMLFRESLRVGKLVRSPTLVANAWHHRSDAASSVVALLGVGCVVIGVPSLDAAGGIVVAAMVTRAGVDSLYEGFSELASDGTADVSAEKLAKVESLLAGKDPDVLRISGLRMRKLGPAGYAVDCRLQVPFYLSVSAAQQVSTKAKMRALRSDEIEVSEVHVSIDAERSIHTGVTRDIVVGGRVNPLESELMRPSSAIVDDVRAAIVLAGVDATHEEVWGLAHATVHWRTSFSCGSDKSIGDGRSERRSGAVVEASLVLDPTLTILRAHEIAVALRSAVLALVPDVADVDLHNELFGKGGLLTARRDVPIEHRLPSFSEAEFILLRSKLSAARIVPGRSKKTPG